MAEAKTTMSFFLKEQLLDAEYSEVASKQVHLKIDTSSSSKPDALNPVELLLASLSACMIEGVQRVAPTIGLDYSALEVTFEAERPTDEARLEKITYLLLVKTSAEQNKLDILNKNLMKFGTIFNTVKSGTNLSGEVKAF